MWNWTEFRELAASTGYVFLVIIILWCALAAIIYWAFVSGTTSMKEDVKYKVVEDDKPVSH
jgi:hypothetical protein